MDLDLSPDANLSERVDAIVDALGDDDEHQQPDTARGADHGDGVVIDGEATEIPAGETADGEPAPDADPASGAKPGDGAQEPPAAAIEFPDTIPHALRDRLRGALPEDLQRDFAQWEAERNRGVNQRLEKSSHAERQAAELQKTISTERQRLAQHLDAAIDVARNFDPVIGQWLSMSDADKARMRQEDFAGYLGLKEDAEARINRVNGLINERRRLAEEESRQGQSASAEQISAQADEARKVLKDELATPEKAKAFAADVEKTLTAYKFTPDEIAGLNDHRMLVVVRDAMRWRGHQAALEAARGKAQPGKAPRVLKPGNGERAPGAQRSAALVKRAAAATSLHDKAGFLAAALDD